jgi:hypothetical protein
VMGEENKRIWQEEQHPSCPSSLTLKKSVFRRDDSCLSLCL